MPARTSHPLRPWWSLGVVAVALATLFLVLLAPGPAHATSTRAKTWGLSELFCDGGISTVWYASLTREQNEFRQDTQPGFDRQLSAIRELHYRAGRVHAFYELDWPNHCGGRS
jgi:hypothetical protein